MRILVCGGRDFIDRKKVYESLSYIKGCIEIECIIHGDARGVDRLARDWAKENLIREEPYPVLKSEWEYYGKSAGHRRNKKMLTEGKPDIIVAFPGGKGTTNMMDQGRKAGLVIVKIP